MAYADCGTYGKLDEFCTANDIPRLPGLHCYDIFAGAEVIAKLFDEEPGTYLLTDYLVRTFNRTVLASLGLDKHPDLWPDYFGNYTRLVWLAQQPNPALEAEAHRIANLFTLPLITIPTGLTGLESALADLLARVGGGGGSRPTLHHFRSLETDKTGVKTTKSDAKTKTDAKSSAAAAPAPPLRRK
jgi:Protein of unknown function (DUF1638)